MISFFPDVNFWLALSNRRSLTQRVRLAPARLAHLGCELGVRPVHTRFQRVHQRYERTRLWRRVESMLGLEPITYPSWLGEDDLAEFGAYREHAAKAFGIVETDSGHTIDSTE